MTIDRYMLRLWFGPFLGGLVFVFSLMLLARALKLLTTFLDNAEAWSLIASLLLLTMPFFFLQVVPMAFFLSLQNTITRLQQSSEMDALRAAGISYRRMFRLFFWIGTLLWLGLGYMAMVLMPQAQLGFNNVLANAYAIKGAISFTPQRFTKGPDGFTIYVDGKDEQGTYHGVMLEDHRDNAPLIYMASSARFDRVGESLLLKLKDGVRLEGEGPNQRVLTFKTYQVSIPLPSASRKVLHSRDHVTTMTTMELWHKLQNDRDATAVAEWNRRLLLPTTVLVLLFFALPLSLTRKRSGKAIAITSGIALLLVVYYLQLLLYQQTNQGSWPGWTMWLGQILLLAAGVFLSLRTESNRLPRLFTRLNR